MFNPFELCVQEVHRALSVAIGAACVSNSSGSFVSSVAFLNHCIALTAVQAIPQSPLAGCRIRQAHLPSWPPGGQ